MESKKSMKFPTIPQPLRASKSTPRVFCSWAWLVLHVQQLGVASPGGGENQRHPKVSSFGDEKGHHKVISLFLKVLCMFTGVPEVLTHVHLFAIKRYAWVVLTCFDPYGTVSYRPMLKFDKSLSEHRAIWFMRFRDRLGLDHSQTHRWCFIKKMQDNLSHAMPYGII